MKILDRIAVNRLLKILTDFIISLLKIFKPKEKNDPIIVPPINKPKRKRPILDWLKNINK